MLAQAIARTLHTNRDNAAVVAFLLTLLQVAAPTLRHNRITNSNLNLLRVVLHFILVK